MDADGRKAVRANANLIHSTDTMVNVQNFRTSLLHHLFFKSSIFGLCSCFVMAGQTKMKYEFEGTWKLN